MYRDSSRAERKNHPIDRFLLASITRVFKAPPRSSVRSIDIRRARKTAPLVHVVTKDSILSFSHHKKY